MSHANRIIAFILIATAGFFMGFMTTQSSVAFAEDGESGPVVLQVFYDDQMMAEYTTEDLETVARTEDSKTYDFSAMSAYPTPELVKGVTGPTVKGVINDAFGKTTIEGLPSGIGELAEDQLIDIKENGEANVYHAAFTVKQLFVDKRYYYPNVNDERSRYGAPAQQSSYEGKKEVPAIFSLTESVEPDKAGRFLIGQITPHEQNKPDWVQGTVTKPETGEEPRPGVIVIQSERAEKLNEITKTDAVGGDKVVFGKAITLDRTANEYKGGGGKRYWIYYTTDGTEPTRESAIYNYNGYLFPSSGEKFNKPVMTEDMGTMTLRIKVFGNGRLESEESEITLTGIPLVKPASIDKGSTTYNSAVIKWAKVTGAEGYEVYRKTGTQTEYTLLRSILGDAAISTADKSLLTGTKYYYKVRAFVKAADGSMIYSPFTSYVKAAPALGKPTFKKLSLKKRTTTVQWKAVAGAGGYQIWRAEKKKTGKYKLVKTIGKGKTVSWKNTKLKKGKKYFYKIRAYRVVKGKKVFSSYSAVKYIKVK